MKTDKKGRDNRKILVVAIALFCVVMIAVFLFKPNNYQNNPLVSTPNSSSNSSATPPYRIVQAEAMQQIYNDVYGPPLQNNMLEYFAYLADLGWNDSSFLEVINNSTELAANEIVLLDSNRTQPVFFNIGVGEAQEPEYAKTILYRQNGRYGVIVELHLERSPAGATPVEFWERDYAYPVSHEMRHVRRFFESGIFDSYQASDNISSDSLYQEYLDKILSEHKIPAEFNSTETAEDLDELGVVLETDNPDEIALNIDRLNSFTINILTNDESLGVSKVAPIYLEQIVLARHLKEAYAKPSVQRLNYSIRASAFDQMNAFSTTFRNELYRAYPGDAEAMQSLEAIYEQDAEQAVKENAE
jgi:hypothetical protein